jgi:hypothetical protein
MEPCISNSVFGNICWNVDKSSPSWNKFIEMNNFLCTNPKGIQHPVGIMKRDDTRTASGDLPDDIKKWGRAFNYPGKIEPHITLTFGAMDIAIVNEINASNSLESSRTFEANKLTIARIDEKGNVFEIIEEFNFGDA